MKETMLSLLALMSAMLLSLNMNRAAVSAQMEVIDNEMETIAGGVALEVLAYVGSTPFDAATVDAEVTDPEDLTALPFTTGFTYAAADDIDDFNQIQTHTLSEFDFDFEIDITVVYVDENNPEVTSAWPTFAKKVTVTINNEYLQTPLELSHVYTYP